MLINEQIRDKEVRLIGADGKQLGIMSVEQAQQLADEANLDLVNISPKAEPPVCRIMDYGKYRFEQEKKLKEAKKNQKTITLKEMRLSATIDKHEEVQEDVFRTVYSNGVTVLVNYNTEAVTVDGVTLEARGYNINLG